METSPKRDRWTEADVAELPAGEHDYFDRKSGRLFDGDRGDLLGTIAKALSAFSNTGGGHLVLGVADDGSLDGVPRTISSRTSTCEWLEQKIPNLLAYALTDFRVHVVERDQQSSLIPLDRDVIVIDVATARWPRTSASRRAAARSGACTTCGRAATRCPRPTSTLNSCASASPTPR